MRHREMRNTVPKCSLFNDMQSEKLLKDLKRWQYKL